MIELPTKDCWRMNLKELGFGASDGALHDGTADAHGFLASRATGRDERGRGPTVGKVV